MTDHFIPQLSHVGIYVRDLVAMEKFYTDVMCMLVTDRGRGKNFKRDIVFMTGNAHQHHQLVIASGREKDAPSTIFQLSFMVQSLEELRVTHARAVAAGVQDMRPMNHGNAWSVYFFDPEENYVEVYLDTPFHIPQPHGNPLDLNMTDEEIFQQTETNCRQEAGFRMRSDYVASMGQALSKPRK